MLMLLDSLDAAQIIWYNIILSYLSMFHLQDDVDWYKKTWIDTQWRSLTLNDDCLLTQKLLIVIECGELWYYNLANILH